MTKGIGNDIIEIKRIRKAIKARGQPFLDRIFTKKEQEYCLLQSDPYPRFSGRFAAKEAIVKAIGWGFGKDASWKDIEILADEKGKPVVHFSDEIRKLLNNPKVLVTISHCKEFAAAVAIYEI